MIHGRWQPIRRGTSPTSKNSRLYGIHRLASIRCAFHACRGTYLAVDWAIMVHTLRFGTHRQVDKLQLFRHEGGASTDRLRLLSRFRRDFLDFFFPMARFTIACLRVGPAYITPRMLLALARYNADYAMLRYLPIAILLPRPIKRLLLPLLGIASGAQRSAHGHQR
jgi:hypothetical protein